MTDRCPTCGQSLPPKWPEADRLLELLRNGQPHREVYRGGDGSGWYVTYGGGQFSQQAVEKLVSTGLVASVYSDCPNEAYHVGRTLDCARTMAERKKHRRAKDAPNIYVDDPVTESASVEGKT